MDSEIYDPEALHGEKGAQQQCRARRLSVHSFSQ